MTYEQFISAVARRAEVPEDQAEEPARAALSVLADRLTAGEADDIASQLPKPLKEVMIPGQPRAQGFGLEEFIRRVASRAGVPEEDATRGARAVMTTLREAISGGEFEDMMAQLPGEFSQLVDRTAAPSPAS